MKDSIRMSCNKTGLEPMLLSDPRCKIYPNPAHGNTFFIELKNPGNNPYRVSIIDMQGRIIRKGIKFWNATEIDIAAIPSGMYVVKISPDGLQNISPSFVKLMKR